ncbi:MAG: phosphoribosylanthranilate isomerase [Marinibacterium sp.]|nr:phosphoribosylanthranilate isomerase [Marinibacterium sp.]
MSGDIQVKICGLTDRAGIEASVNAGARYLGFNFFPKSPRYVTPVQAAELAMSVPPGVCKVALTVDADNALLDDITGHAPFDMLQLHGHETPARVAEVKARYGLPVMKVVGVANVEDLANVEAHSTVADQILVDAKPPKGAVLPGGNGIAFDWKLIAGRRWPVPWMLAGGLTPENVSEAIAQTGARQVDVSSGVESAPGCKDADMIADFLASTK